MLNLEKLAEAVRAGQRALELMKTAGDESISLQDQAENMEDAIASFKRAAIEAEEFSEQYYDEKGNIRENV